MASFGKVLDLLDDRYLELQDVIGNVEPLPTLVPYEEYIQNVLVYRMGTNHEIFMGLIQDFTMRRAYEMGKELWTWCIQWQVDNSSSRQQQSSPKKPRLDAQQTFAPSNAPPTPRQAPAITIFERRTLDGALMLEEDMLRILIDIVQVASALVPNFIEFLYRWIDYYEGDGKALKAALRWEIPSLWDFEYHPLVLPPEMKKDSGTDAGDGTHASGQQETRVQSAKHAQIAEARQSSPTKKMHARPKPDLAAIERQTFFTEESERLQYREVKYGIQPPKLEQPLPPLINIPRDQRKRVKYYAACFKSRQRALYLLLEAGVTMRQINNYQKLQTAHPKETPESGDENGLRNYQKDAKYAQAQFELKEKQIKQREIAISNRLAVEAQFAAQNAVADGAVGMPLIPPTPSYAKRPDMAASMMERIIATRAKKDERIRYVPKPLVGRMKSRFLKEAVEEPQFVPQIQEFLAQWYTVRPLSRQEEESAEEWDPDERLSMVEEEVEEEEEEGNDEGIGDDEDKEMDDDDSSDEGDDNSATTIPATSFLSLPRPTLPSSLPTQAPTVLQGSVTPPANAATSSPIPDPSAFNNSVTAAARPHDDSTPANVATYMENLNSEQAQRLLPLLNPAARQAATSRLEESAQIPTPTLQETVSANGQSDEDAAIDRYVLERPSLPMSFLTMPFYKASEEQELPSLFQNTLDLSTTPTLYPPPTASSLTAAEQQSSQDTTSRDARSNNSSNPSHSVSESESESNSVLRTAIAKSFEVDVPMPPTRPQPTPQPVSSYGDSTRLDMFSDYGAGNSRITLTDVGNPNINPPSTSIPEVAQQQNSNASSASQWSLPLTPTNELHQSTPSPIGLQQYSTAQGTRNIPVYALPLTNAEPTRPYIQPSPYPPPSTAMLPPPGPGITRNAPSPLSLSPPKSSPLTTLAPHILATTPFQDPSSNPGTPIQIYIPKIVIPGNGLGPNGKKMGDGGCVETDALLLGHETGGGKLALTKAILLPMGVWENTLRKVRSGRWSVLETYECPASHPAKGKGKGRMGDGGEWERGPHRAVYDKLATAYGMMTRDAGLREAELTKRWRVSRGPMTAFDRGAVWEGWGVYVDRGVEMSREERKGALRRDLDGAFGKVDDGGISDEYGLYATLGERERRRREMDELMDEDEEDEDEEMEG